MELYEVFGLGGQAVRSLQANGGGYDAWPPGSADIASPLSTVRPPHNPGARTAVSRWRGESEVMIDPATDQTTCELDEHVEEVRT